MKPDETPATEQRPRRSPGRARPRPAPGCRVRQHRHATAPVAAPAMRTRWTGAIVTTIFAVVFCPLVWEACYGRTAAGGDVLLFGALPRSSCLFAPHITAPGAIFLARFWPQITG